MTKRLLIAALLLSLTLPAFAGGFDDIARAIDGHRGAKRVWMPGLGLARFLVWIVRPKGVHDFQIATFKGTDDIDPHDLNAVMESHVDRGFTPMVRTWSKRSGEWSFIYARARENSDRVELMVLAHDDEDTVLVRVDVDASIVAREMNVTPRNVSRYARQ
jgi:hypothetical protein